MRNVAPFPASGDFSLGKKLFLSRKLPLVRKTKRDEPTLWGLREKERWVGRGVCYACLRCLLTLPHKLPMYGMAGCCTPCTLLAASGVQATAQTK